MATTIQITKELRDELSKRKLLARETYEDVIWGLIEDKMEVSKQTKKDIAKARKEVCKGKYTTMEEIKKKYRYR
jgi:hypothetical protein